MRGVGERPFVISEKQTAPGIPEMLLDGKYPRLEGRFHPGVTQYEVTPGSPTIEQNHRRAVYTDCFEYIPVSLITLRK